MYGTGGLTDASRLYLKITFHSFTGMKALLEYIFIIALKGRILPEGILAVQISHSFKVKGRL
jgi:hypothetical protein